MRYLLLLFFIAISALVQAQDHILLMNGQTIDCKIVSDSGIYMVVEVHNRKGKIKLREVHKNDLFSFTKEGQKEKIVYVQDSILGDIYSDDQMKMYLAGENDARTNFKGHKELIIGFVVCGTISFISGDGYITTLGPPVLWTLVQMVGKVRIRERYISDLNYQYNDLYAEGFEPPARSKKLIRAMEGGFAGAAAGLLIWLAVNSGK